MANISAKTKKIIDIFQKISEVPRCSENQEKIGNWLMNWANENHFEADKDEVGNVLIKIPATNGINNTEPIIIQGHMDMVCEKTPDSNHDFSKDPIELVYEGEWLTANKTTLGADNGIALAIGMALALDKEIKHPPIDLLFTVDEETGLVGANNLQPDFIRGKYLINIDSEEEGVFTIGCAGGKDTNLTLPLETDNIFVSKKFLMISVGGAKGGHSGIDIDKYKANAIKIVTRSLDKIYEITDDFRLVDIKGGSAHNAIPRDASAIITFQSEDTLKIIRLLKTFESMVKTEYASTDPDLFIKVEELTYKEQPSSFKDTKKIINFIKAIPHGPAAMSTQEKGLVETSNNLAIVSIDNSKLKVKSSQRSSVLSRLEAITRRIEGISELAGGTFESGNGYVPWEPNWDSKFLKLSKDVYKELYAKDPEIAVIHAGLECGIIGSKKDGMEMISIGPSLKHPHCPDEKVLISDIDKIWDFVVELLNKV